MRYKPSIFDKEKDACPNKGNHMEGPEGYIARYDWAMDMLKTHKQKRCSGCGYWVIWEPK